jgi:hypothetical protein
MRRLPIALAFALGVSSLGLLAGCAVDATASDAATTDEAITSTERAAIMNALRVKVRPELRNQDIVFNVSEGHFKAQSGYAFLSGQIQLRSTGAPVDYRGTEYQQYIDEGWFDDHIDALLKKESGGWKVVTHVIGATDVAWEGWWEEYGAPRSIFPGQADEDHASSERRAVMDSLREKLKPELRNQDIVFHVRDVGAYAAAGDFAFLRGQIRLRDGRPVDYRGTEYQEYIDEGLFDDGFAALLKKQGDQWVVLAHVIGPTDVPWVTWAEDFGAPADIFR